MPATNYQYRLHRKPLARKRTSILVNLHSHPGEPTPAVLNPSLSLSEDHTTIPTSMVLRATIRPLSASFSTSFPAQILRRGIATLPSNPYIVRLPSPLQRFSTSLLCPSFPFTNNHTLPLPQTHPPRSFTSIPPTPLPPSNPPLT